MERELLNKAREEEENKGKIKILSEKDINKEKEYEEKKEAEVTTEDLENVVKNIYSSSNFEATYLQDTYNLRHFPEDTLVIPLIKIKHLNKFVNDVVIEYIPYVSAIRVNVVDKRKSVIDRTVNIFRHGFYNDNTCSSVRDYLSNLYKIASDVSDANKEDLEKLLDEVVNVLLNKILYFYNIIPYFKQVKKAKLPYPDPTNKEHIRLIEDVITLSLYQKPEFGGLTSLLYNKPRISSPYLAYENLYTYTHFDHPLTNHSSSKDYPVIVENNVCTVTINWERIGEQDYLVTKRVINGVIVDRELTPIPLVNTENNNRINPEKQLLLRYFESLLFDDECYKFLETRNMFNKIINLNDVILAKKNNESYCAIKVFRDSIKPLLEIEKVKVPSVNGEYLIVYKGYVVKSSYNNFKYHNFWCSNNDELRAALVHGFTVLKGTVLLSEKHILEDLSDILVHDILKDDTEEKYSIRHTLNGIPEDESEFDEEEWDNDYNNVVLDNLTEEMRQYNSYHIINYLGEEVDLIYKIEPKVIDHDNVIVVTAYRRDSSISFDVAENGVYGLNTGMNLFFSAYVSKGNNGELAVRPMYSNSTNFSYFSRHINNDDLDTKERIVKDLCQPIQNGILNEFLLSYFDLL